MATRRPRLRTLLLAAIAALLLADAVLLVVTLARKGRDPQPIQGWKGLGGTEGGKGLHERNAEALFARAQRAAGLSQWAVALDELDRLKADFADTRFFADRGIEIANLRAKAEAALQPVVPPLPNLPESALRTALEAWPVAFEDALDQKPCLQRALLAPGQYGGRFDVNGALILSGVHTTSAAWWNCPVGDAFALSFDLKAKGGEPCVWLCGPGYGNSVDVGYTLRFAPEGGELRMQLHREGKPVALPLLKTPFLRDDWYHFDLVRNKGAIAIHVDGERLGEWTDPAPLAGPAHAFVALGGSHGFFGADGTWYRALAIRMPKADADRLAAEPVERVFDPPAARPPAPNATPLATDDFAQDGLAQWTIADRPEAVRKTEDGVVLRGPNAWPCLWRNKPLVGDFAAEFEMRYFSGGEALNLHVRLRMGEFLDPKSQSFQGWSVSFPRGDGTVLIDWFGPEGKAHCLASTPRFAPSQGRPYVLRIEKKANTLRIFSNGGFLLEATAPGPVPPEALFYPGMLQIYGGSLVRRMAAWQLR